MYIEYLGGDDLDVESSRIEETYLSINTSSLQWILVNAIKEQHKLIQEKELKIANLETQLTQVQARLAKLEAAILNH